MHYQSNFSELNVNQLRCFSAYQNTAQDLPYDTPIIFVLLAWFKKSSFRENKSEHGKQKWILADQYNLKKKMASF